MLRDPFLVSIPFFPSSIVRLYSEPKLSETEKKQVQARASSTKSEKKPIVKLVKDTNPFDFVTIDGKSLDLMAQIDEIVGDKIPKNILDQI